MSYWAVSPACARSTHYGRAATHRIGEIEVLHFMMDGENQQKRCIGCAERITAAERHGMGENDPAFAGMNSDCVIACPGYQTLSAVSPVRPGKVSDQPKRCGNHGDNSNIRSGVQGEVRLPFVFQRRQISLDEQSRQHRQINGSLEQAVVHRRSRPAHAALVKARHA